MQDLPSDPRLSRFNPLPRILAFDDFDEGMNGWCENGPDAGPPQISAAHGSVSCNYALKLATRARALHSASAVKRLTYAKPALVQFETYFIYKYGAGDFSISNDISEGERGLRYKTGLRYANADGWQYRTSVEEAGDWRALPGGRQPLCNKLNWHYLRWLFDMRERCSVELQSNGLVLDLRDVPVPMYGHGERALSRMMNFEVRVRTQTGARNFLYLDSALISVDW